MIEVIEVARAVLNGQACRARGACNADDGTGAVRRCVANKPPQAGQQPAFKSSGQRWAAV